MIRATLTQDVPVFRLRAGTPAHIVKETRKGALLRVGGRLGLFFRDEYEAVTKGRKVMAAANAKDCTKANNVTVEREQVLIK